MKRSSVRTRAKLTTHRFPDIPEAERYDAVVIGGGPAGLFAAYILAIANRRTLLLEAGRPMLQSLCPKIKTTLSGRLVKGSERFALQCSRCTCLRGLGGAAFHFDTNLGSPSALGRPKVERRPDGSIVAFNTLARALASQHRAEETLRDVFKILNQHGLPAVGPELSGVDKVTEFDKHFVAADLSLSQSITIDRALGIVDSMIAGFLRSGGEVRFLNQAKAIERGHRSRFVVETKAPGGSAARIEAHNVIVAVGKLGLSWVRELIERLHLDVQPVETVDVGVRLEGERARLAPLSEHCSNPKLSYINGRGETVRTFCVCAGGRIMQYEFESAVVLDGQHCIATPTERTNFGIVTAHKVPSHADGTDLALDIARRVTRRGGGRPIACTVGQLRCSYAGRPHASEQTLHTSLINYARAPLWEVLPNSIVEDVLEMVNRLNAVHPEMIDDAAVLAAPVVERLYPRLQLSDSMESSERGLFFVGDASSKIIGVTYGAATGMVAAQAVAAEAR